jgi:hypothetical protein
MSKLKPASFFLLTIAIYLGSLFFYESWTWAVVGGGDPWGYYAYLPAAFIHHDLDNLQRTVEVRKLYKPGTVRPKDDNPLGIGEALRVENHPNGDTSNYVIKYTMGIAILESPFFAAAHAYAKLTGSHPADGWSLPYILAIHLAGLCYAIWGLWLLWLTLRRFFSENVTLAVLAALALATNLYYFCVYAGVMAHAFQFFLFALAIYATVRWYEHQRLGHAMLLGFACGMVTLVRPTEIILLAVPLLFGLKPGHGLKERLQLLRSNLSHIAMAALAFCLAGLPQLLYWKWTSGHFLYYSYGEEGFDFLKPHLWRGLVGYKNGWLAYTPVMWLGIFGLFLLRRNAKDWCWPVWVFVPVNVYIVYSWWCWNYINGFGSRPMVEAAAVMAFPLASFFMLAAKRKWLLALTAVAVLFCMWLNIFNTWQFKKGLILSDSGKGAYFWRMLGKTEMNYLDLVVYDTGEPQPNPDDIRMNRVLYTDGFEQLADTAALAKKAFAGYRALKIEGLKDDQQHEQTFFEAKISDLGLQRGQWIKISAQAYITGRPKRMYEGNYLTCRFMRGKKSRKSRSIRLDSKPGNNPVSLWGGKDNLWGEAYYWVKVPPFLRPDDELQIGFNSLNAKTVYLDELKVEVWE